MSLRFATALAFICAAALSLAGCGDSPAMPMDSASLKKVADNYPRGVADILANFDKKVYDGKSDDQVKLIQAKKQLEMLEHTMELTAYKLPETLDAAIEALEGNGGIEAKMTATEFTNDFILTVVKAMPTKPGVQVDPSKPIVLNDIADTSSLPGDFVAKAERLMNDIKKK